MDADLSARHTLSPSELVLSDNARRVARDSSRRHARALDIDKALRRARCRARHDMFSGPRRCDEALGQARQRALHNARHFAQRAAQHVALVAHAGVAKQERWPAQRRDGRELLLQICATRVPPGSQRKMGHAATKTIAAKMHACMQRITLPRCQRVQHR